MAKTDSIQTREAQQHLEAIGRQQADLTAKRATLRQQLERMQQEAALGAYPNREQLRAMAEVAVEIDVISAMLPTVDAERAAAELSLEHLRVDELRSEAERKRDQLKELESKTAEFLKKLAALELVPYTGSVLSSQPAPGLWLDRMTLKPATPWRSIFELVPNNPGAPENVCVPLSRRLRQEIEDLELRALELERQLEQKAVAAAPKPEKVLYRGEFVPADESAETYLARRSRQGDERSFDDRAPTHALLQSAKPVTEPAQRERPVNARDAY